MMQNSSKDPIARSLVLLRLIPAHPRSVSTVELRDALQAEGFDINLRSLQRDLAGKLSALFQLVCSSDDADETVRRARPYRWSFAAGAKTSLPAIRPASALAMRMAEAHLRHVLPPAVLALLDPQFSEARELLHAMEHNGLSQWSRRVRVVPPSRLPVPATIVPGVWDEMAAALLTGRMLSGRYLSRAKGRTIDLVLHPAGLASRGATTYLIARVDDFDDFRHFALHRFREVKVLEARADDRDFDMPTYMESAAFSPRLGEGGLRLAAQIHPHLAWSLAENPLAPDQALVPIEGSDWMTLQVALPDDEETMTWLLGQAERIHVLAPEPLRQRVARRTLEAANCYASLSIDVHPHPAPPHPR